MSADLSVFCLLDYTVRRTITTIISQLSTNEHSDPEPEYTITNRIARIGKSGTEWLTGLHSNHQDKKSRAYYYPAVSRAFWSRREFQTNVGLFVVCCASILREETETDSATIQPQRTLLDATSALSRFRWLHLPSLLSRREIHSNGLIQGLE